MKTFSNYILGPLTLSTCNGSRNQRLCNKFVIRVSLLTFDHFTKTFLLKPDSEFIIIIIYLKDFCVKNLGKKSLSLPSQ